MDIIEFFRNLFGRYTPFIILGVLAALVIGLWVVVAIFAN